MDTPFTGRVNIKKIEILLVFGRELYDTYGSIQSFHALNEKERFKNLVSSGKAKCT